VSSLALITTAPELPDFGRVFEAELDYIWNARRRLLTACDETLRREGCSMNHAMRGWFGTSLLVGLFWVGRAGAQECEPDGGAGCGKDSQCIPYTCSNAPVYRGMCEPSLGLCPNGAADGTPCGSGMTCRSHHEILGVSFLDGGGFSCAALISYCSLPPADSGDAAVGAASGTETTGAADAGHFVAAGGSTSTNGLGAGASSSGATQSTGGRSSETEAPLDGGATESHASKSDGSSCSVSSGRSARFPALGTLGAPLIVVARRKRRHRVGAQPV
jgi:hypothetical protein